MIKCEDVCVLEELFSRNMGETVDGIEIPVKLETNFAPNVNKDLCDAKLELLMEVGGGETSEYPFYYKIRIAGIFKWEDISTEEAEKDISSDGSEILYSFVRTYFYEVLKKANLNTVILPSIKN